MASRKQIRTFRELCHYGAKYVSDQEIFDPELNSNLIRPMPVLVEMVGNKRWIARLIAKYNQMGFYTQMSQPGTIYKDPAYISHWHYMRYCLGRKRKHADDDDYPDIILKDAKYTTGQRASVSGFMLRDMAEKVYEELRSNDNLIVRLSCKDEPVPEEYQLMTITLKDGKPMFKELKEAEKLGEELGLVKEFGGEDDFKKIPHIRSTGFTEGIADPNSFSFVCQYSQLNLDPKYLEDNVVVYLQVMDKRWNDNSVLWTELMRAIKKHKIW